MSNNDSNNKYDAAFDGDMNTHDEKSKAESLLNFIKGVKENAAYQNVDTNIHSTDAKDVDSSEDVKEAAAPMEQAVVLDAENDLAIKEDSTSPVTESAKPTTTPINEVAKESSTIVTEATKDETTKAVVNETKEAPKKHDASKQALAKAIIEKQAVEPTTVKAEATVKEEAVKVEFVKAETKVDLSADAITEDNIAKETSEEISVLSDTKDDDSVQTVEETSTAATQPVVEKPIDEAAFNQGFNPGFAFYDDEGNSNETAVLETTEDNSIVTEPMVAEEVHTEQPVTAPAETVATVAETATTFERMDKSSSVPAKTAKVSSLASVRDKLRFEKKPKADAKTKTSGESKQFTNPLKGLSKRMVSAIAVAVFLVAVLATGGVLAAKGMIPVFASNEVYGIFSGDKLVAASNTAGKIEEAIDDFLIHYKTLEEQSSISNLRITSPYEVRELSRDEIKEHIYSEKNTKASESTPQTTASVTGETQQATGETQANADDETTTTMQHTTTAAPQEGESTTFATTNQEHPLNAHGEAIEITDSVEELKNILFYGSAPRHYTVVEGDNLSKIAHREGLTLTELMVPNPDLLEDSTIGIDQEILIVRMAGPLKLSFGREVTYTEDIAYKTVEEKTEDLFEGEKQTTQQGKEGIRQEITKYDYENNVIAVKTPVSEDVISEPTNKIVRVGTKKKTSEDQSSGLSDSGEKPQESTSSGYMWPVSGYRITSNFGPRKAPKRGASSYHRGLDLALASGKPIYATQSGTVTIASYTGGYGNLVEINHGGGMTSRYGHCLSLKVKRGEKVEKGQLIALVGSTGVSTGPHVHFEIRKNGSAVNPKNYLS